MTAVPPARHADGDPVVDIGWTILGLALVAAAVILAVLAATGRGP